VPIVALTPDDATRRRLSFVWGVTAITAHPADGALADVLAFFREPLRRTGLVPEGAPVVVTAGWPFGATTNLVHATTL